jgi:hypothetical protein
VAVSFIGGGNQSTQRKPQTCLKLIYCKNILSHLYLNNMFEFGFFFSLVEDMVEIQHIEEDEKHPVDLKGYFKCWEQIIDKDHFKVWRKPIPNTYLYEYKGLYIKVRVNIIYFHV